MDPVTITSLELENVKRVRAVALTPAATGLTTIGGDNRQGKTSVLDAICFALGGEKYRPTNLKREGGMADARIRLELSNGLVVERKGKNASLSVTDPTGKKSGQRLLDSFVEELALNLPRFMQASARDKAATLLRTLGIEDKLAAIDREEKAAYDSRTAAGRIADQKAKYAAEMPEHHDVPTEPLSGADMVRESQAIMARNAERAAARKAIDKLAADAARCAERKHAAGRRVAELAAALDAAQRDLLTASADHDAATARCAEADKTPITADETTDAIAAKLADIEVINAKVRANLDKAKAADDAKAASEEVDKLTAQVDAIRARRAAFLAGVQMPFPGLSVENGELVLNGKAWDCMSGAEQLQASVAIVRAVRPECGFVLLDGLEVLDTATLAEFGAWLTANGMQAIATRVSRGDECTIIIEDGVVAGQAGADSQATTSTEPAAAGEQDW